MPDSTAIDFETANRDRGVCAVGLVRVADGRIVDRYTTLVRLPRRSTTSTASTEFHGITLDHVADAPWPRVHETILEFADGGPVAHNAVFEWASSGRLRPQRPADHPLDYVCSLTPRGGPGLRCATTGAHGLPPHRARPAPPPRRRRRRRGRRAHHARRSGSTAWRRRPSCAGGCAARRGAPPRPAGPTLPEALRTPGAKFDRWRRRPRRRCPSRTPTPAPAARCSGASCASAASWLPCPSPRRRRIAAAAASPPKRHAPHRRPGHGRQRWRRTAKHRRAESYNATGSAIDIIDEAELRPGWPPGRARSAAHRSEGGSEDRRRRPS